MMDVKAFIVEWNKVMNDLDVHDVVLEIREASEANDRAIEFLVYHTNISDFPIGSINFLPEITPYDEINFSSVFMMSVILFFGTKIPMRSWPKIPIGKTSIAT